MNFALGARGHGAAGSGATMENLEKQLICPVCLEMFSKPVVILPCQHNLCRKCASDVFQAANPLGQLRPPSNMAASGSRFRCPSCRHEVILDRHGVYGLQRNLLVENIIDIYRQSESMRLEKVKQQQPMCEEHEDEKINIYCQSCQTPTCSMCKVFGQHKDCQVAPLSSVYATQRSELSDSIAMLVAHNDHVQAVLSRMEEICRAVEENGSQQQQQLSQHFGFLTLQLEERKQELVAEISREQDHKLRHFRGLIRCHSDQLEAAVSLVEAAIQLLHQANVPLFIQNASTILDQMAVASRASIMERPELGYENMNFVIDTDDVSDLLRSIDFCSAVLDGEEEDGEDESQLDFS